MVLEYFSEEVVAVLKCLFLLQLLASAVLIVVMRYPLLLFRMWQRWFIFRKGFKVKKVKVGDNYQFEYMEKGNPENCSMSVLMVHGYTSSKDSWCLMGYHFPRRVHIVAMDLPGHGGTTRIDKEECGTEALARRINQFSDAIGINKRKYHLMGISLGGHVAGLIAAMYPRNILSLTMICPHGIHAPSKSKLQEIYEKEQKVMLLPQTDDEFKDMIALLVHKPVQMPKLIISGIMQARLKGQTFYENMLKELISEPTCFLLQDKLEEIKIPTLVVWGKEDQAIHVSSVDVIKEKRPDFKFHIIEECGHSVTLERPRKLANIITAFLNEF